jgi:hypothetical protein
MTTHRILALCAIAPLVVAGLTGTARAAAKPTFGVAAAPFTKIGDSETSGNQYATGYHNLVRNGSELYFVYGVQGGWGNGVAADGTVQSAQAEDAIRVTVSLDAGVTWPVSVPVVHGVVDMNGLGIALGPDPLDPAASRLHVVFASRIARAAMHTWAKVSRANGAVTVGSFSVPTRVSAEGVTVQTYTTAIAADGLGGVHVLYTGYWFPTPETFAEALLHSESHDGGATFAAPTALLPYGGEPSIAADAAGNVFLAVGAGAPEGWTPMFLRRLAGGAWSAPAAIPGSLANVTANVSLAVRDVDHVYVAWGNSSDTGYALAVARTDRGGTDTADWLVRKDVAEGDENSLAVSPTGALGLAYTDGGIVYFVRSLDDGATWTTATAATAGLRAYYPHLAFDAEGKAMIAYGAGPALFTRER